MGYGIVAPEYEWDDYKGVDLKGKVLLMMNNDPEDDPKLFAGKTRLYYGRWTYKYEMAAQTGAAGAIIIHTEPSAGYKWQVVQTLVDRASSSRCRHEGEPELQVKAWTTEDGVAADRAPGRPGPRRPARGRGRSATSSPVPLGVHAEHHPAQRRRRRSRRRT